jgi:signal transduction histidine kinase
LVAHGVTPGSVGVNRRNLKDPDGKFLVQEKSKAGGNNAGGWVDGTWPHPTSNRIEEKNTFSMTEGELLASCGICK